MNSYIIVLNRNYGVRKQKDAQQKKKNERKRKEEARERREKKKWRIKKNERSEDKLKKIKIMKG